MHTARPGLGTQKVKKMLLVAAAVLIFLSVCASALEIAARAGHDCTCTCGGLLGIGCTCGSCHTCAVLSVASELIRTAFICAVALATGATGRLAFICSADEPVTHRTRSLIWLKVKLSD